MNTHDRNAIRAGGWLLLIGFHLPGCHTAEIEPATLESTSTIDDPTAGVGAAGTSPDAIFRTGAIERIQRALCDHGFNVSITRKLDPETERALAHFQQDRKLPSTGFPDHETLRLLDLDPRDLYLPNPSRR